MAVFGFGSPHAYLANTWSGQGVTAITTMPSAQYWNFYRPTPSAAPPLTVKAYNALMLRRANLLIREYEPPVPASLIIAVRFVRRQLQRRGPVGFARLGGRRPL